MGKTRGKSEVFTPEQAATLQRVLVRVSRLYNSQAELALALSRVGLGPITQQAISRAISTGYCSLPTANRLARLCGHRHALDLIDAEDPLKVPSGTNSSVTGMQNRTLSARVQAVQQARLAQLPEAAIARVEATEGLDSASLTYWRLRLLREAVVEVEAELERERNRR